MDISNSHIYAIAPVFACEESVEDLASLFDRFDSCGVGVGVDLSAKGGGFNRLYLSHE